jgi:release factor glutamine methyltransferase
MKIKEVLDRTTLFFKEKKIDTARFDAEILLSSSLGIRRIDLYLKFDQPLDETELERCRALVRRRSTGEPVAYILGSKGFMGFDFEVNSAVLIPRPETELLVERALAWVHESSKEKEALNILDLGTGSGCIGISLLKSLPNAKCTFVDLSTEALLVAKKNAESLGVLDRSEFINIDAAKFATDKAFDLVLANPPYIAQDDVNVQESVKKFEPHLALFSEENGLYALKSWSKKLVGMLKTNSFVGFEYGMGQSTEAKLHFQSLGCFNEIEIIQDYSKIDRHIVGIRRDA